MVLTGDDAVRGLVIAMTPVQGDGVTVTHGGTRYWFHSADQAAAVAAELGWESFEVVGDHRAEG